MALFDAACHAQKLPVELLDIAKEYHTNYQQYEKELDEFQEYLRNDNHLPELNRSQLFMFLKCKGFNMDVAGTTLDKYFTMRTCYKDIFHNRCVGSQKTNTVLDLVEMGFYPPDVLTPDGYRLALLRLQSYDASKLNFMDGLRAVTAAVDLETARTPYAKGIVIIMDSAGVNMGYVTRINIIGLSHFMCYLQNCGIKVAAVHVLNCNFLVKYIMTIMKPLLTEALASVLFFYTSNQLEGFYKAVPYKLLPKEYGGEVESVVILNKQFRQRLLAVKDWVQDIESERYQVDETKRKTKNKLSTQSRRQSGGLRELCID